MGALAPMPPRNRPAAGAATGGGQPSSRTATRVVAALDLVSVAPSARRLSPRSRAEQRDGPCGCWLPSPSVCAEEHSGQRIRARDCLSAASLSETPLDASTAGCPKRSAGTQTVGSPSFAFFSWRRKKRRCAAGRTSRHPPLAQACNPISAQAPASTSSARTGGSRAQASTDSTQTGGGGAQASTGSAQTDGEEVAPPRRQAQLKRTGAIRRSLSIS
jgi:hypothetical protein